jgi:hypothetical protein
MRAGPNSLKAKAEWVCPTRPDLILQAGSAAQIGAIPRAVWQQRDILTLRNGGQFNIAVTAHVPRVGSRMKCDLRMMPMGYHSQGRRNETHLLPYLDWTNAVRLLAGGPLASVSRSSPRSSDDIVRRSFVKSDAICSSTSRYPISAAIIA